MLTDAACRTAKPADRPYKLADAGGMFLHVATSGTKTWRWKYRIAGREKQLVIGRYPEVSLAQARLARQELAALLRTGRDPSVERQKERAMTGLRNAQTFKAEAEDWLATQRPVWSARYYDIVAASLEADVYPAIGRLPVADITPAMIGSIVRRVAARGAVETAHRTAQRISAVFVRAMVEGRIDRDPAAHIGRLLPKARQGRSPALGTITEARAALLAIEGEKAHPLTLLASRLIALTAVRSQSVRLAAPSEFELDAATPVWRVPAANLKLGLDAKADPAMELVVPLSRQSAELVRLAMRLSGGAPLIFRSIRFARRPISDSAISKLYRSAGLAGRLVPHGWRGTFSTIMNEHAIAQGMPGDRAIIDLMLGHVPQGVEARYNRAAYMARRAEIAQLWADWLLDGARPLEELVRAA